VLDGPDSDLLGRREPEAGRLGATGAGFDPVILNTGARSHTSVALLDASRSLNKPLIEVHLSNIYR
jgi:3-dehydroquinate dehydratase II